MFRSISSAGVDNHDLIDPLFCIYIYETLSCIFYRAYNTTAPRDH